MDGELLEFLREVVERIEAKQDAAEDQTGDEVSLREKLLMLELSWKLKGRDAPARPGVDWSTHLPLLLALAVLVAAAVAAALGVDVRRLLP